MSKLKKLIITAASVLTLVAASVPVFAAVDPGVSTEAYIGYSINNSNYVVGKAYATTTTSTMTKLNVQGTFSKGTVQKEQGVASVTTKNTEAAWYTTDSNQYAASTTGWKLSSVSRTYYSGGSYDQDTASDSW